MKTIEIKNLEDLERVADEFVPLMDDATVVAFYGDMGAAQILQSGFAGSGHTSE